MNNVISALARIKIAPYGNLVGNCRDIVDANGEKTAAVCEGQSSDFFRVPTAFRQCAKIAVKTKTAVVTQLTKRCEALRGKKIGRRTSDVGRGAEAEAGRPRYLRGLGSQLETACLPSGMQLDALDCVFSAAVTASCLALALPCLCLSRCCCCRCLCRLRVQLERHVVDVDVAFWPSCDTVAD